MGIPLPLAQELTPLLQRQEVKLLLLRDLFQKDRREFQGSLDKLALFPEELPRPGMVQIIQTFRDAVELLHLAEDREAAELWLAKNPHSDARLEVVGDGRPPEPAAMASAA